LKKTRIVILDLVIFSVILFSSKKIIAQEVQIDSIITKCAIAICGGDNIQDIKTLKMKQIWKDNGSEKIVRLIEIKRPNLYRKKEKNVYIFDGKRVGVVKGISEDGKEITELVSSDHWWHFEIDIASYFPAFFDYPSEYLGEEIIDGKSVYVIQSNMPLGTEMKYLIDKNTYLPVGHILLVNGKEFHTLLSDYKKVGGIIYPHTRHSYSPKTKEKTRERNILNLEVNIEFDDKHFKLSGNK